MHENVAMLLNGGVKAALTFMGIRSFAKNGCLSSPPGTVSYFGGNRGSCREWLEQAAGRIVPSWQRPGKDGGAGGARWLMPQALQGLRPAAAWGPYPGTDTHIRHCRVLGLRAETCTCRTAQCGKCWKTFADAADVSTRFHTLVRTLKTNVKIRPTLFDLLNTNHFKPPCQQKVIFPSYFYFIGKRENSLTRVF